jgi:hypothetical protein
MAKLNLNLSKATETTFEPIPTGTYNAVVFEADMTETKGREGAKLPAGTPMLQLQFKVTDGEYENRRLWRTYPIPPKGYENEEAMNGVLYGTLKALGVVDEPSKLDIDVDELNGLPCKIAVGQHTYNGEIQNDVKRVKPAGSDTEASDILP